MPLIVIPTLGLILLAVLAAIVIVLIPPLLRRIARFEQTAGQPVDPQSPEAVQANNPSMLVVALFAIGAMGICKFAMGIASPAELTIAGGIGASLGLWFECRGDRACRSRGDAFMRTTKTAAGALLMIFLAVGAFVLLFNARVVHHDNSVAMHDAPQPFMENAEFAKPKINLQAPAVVVGPIGPKGPVGPKAPLIETTLTGAVSDDSDDDDLEEGPEATEDEGDDSDEADEESKQSDGEDPEGEDDDEGEETEPADAAPSDGESELPKQESAQSQPAWMTRPLGANETIVASGPFQSVEECRRASADAIADWARKTLQTQIGELPEDLTEIGADVAELRERLVRGEYVEQRETSVGKMVVLHRLLQLEEEDARWFVARAEVWRKQGAGTRVALVGGGVLMGLTALYGLLGMGGGAREA